MSDPRNVAHDKKVKHEKEHEKPEAAPAHKATPAAEVVEADEGPNELEKSLAVLSKLKEMDFHSRANIETLAGLILTIDDELKQKEFSDPMGELYGAQDGFHSKIAEVITKYEAKCESLKESV